jgi:virulence factor Mce-like protein
VIKQAPSRAGLAAMAAFALSVLGLTIFLWLSFGGSIPLKPKSYRLTVAVPEAATLVTEADVRISDVNVGKVKSKRLDKRGARTLVELEIEPRYAPIARDARATLRLKTLLGETYIELAPGHRKAGTLPDGGRLPDAQVRRSVELDEVAGTFDKPTQRAFGDGAVEIGRALGAGRAQDLNAALGNLAGFSEDGDKLFTVLDREGISLQRLIRNGGVVFGALNERRGALRELIQSSDDTFGALASQDRALADTVSIAPTFLDETRLTTARVARSLTRAAPLVRDLGPAADDLRPTLRDLAALSPDLRATFRTLDPLIRSSRSGLPALARTFRGAGPVVDALPPFAREALPVVSMLGFFQSRVANFLANGGAGLRYNIGGDFAVANAPVASPQMFTQLPNRPEFDRGNAYLQPNFIQRYTALGSLEAFDCSKAVGPRNRFGDVKGNDAVNAPAQTKILARRPPCLVQGPSLYDNKLFNLATRARAPIKRPPEGLEGGPVGGRP